MSRATRWTSRDLEQLPADGHRYEIIDGELHVSTQPHFYHQLTCVATIRVLDRWNADTAAGRVAIAPGVVFAEDDDVAPDLVWISKARLAATLRSDGHLHAAPELVVEVLSPGPVNERRDLVAKLALYARRGVDEYWVLNWRNRSVTVYRRDERTLGLVGTFDESDILQSPFLPGFRGEVGALFADIPAD